MIADPPPFYARFLKSLFAPEARATFQSAKDDATEPSQPPVRLLRKPEVKLLEQPATALKALPPPESAKPDILALPDRDHLRSVEPDMDHLQYGGRSMREGGHDA